MRTRYLMVGGGLAAVSAAEEIRRRDGAGSILVVGQEIHRPYRRSLLTGAYLRRELSREGLFTHPLEWFADHRVQLMTGKRAAQLDASRHCVILADGQDVTYDYLLVATGASPRRLDVAGGNFANVFLLRNVEDVDRLALAAENARRAGRPHPDGRGRATVVGGGVIGVEVAASLSMMGLCVDLLVAGPWPWDKFAGEVAGRFLQRHLQRHGVRVHVDCPAERVEGDGRAQRVVGSKVACECDLVVEAVGASSNRELLRSTAVAAGKCILTDEFTRTNVADIFAAGDCAAVFDPRFGKHRSGEHCDLAEGTGRLAGMNMSGGKVPYTAMAPFSTNLFGITVRAWGEARLIERRIVRGHVSGENGGLAEIGIDATGKVVHVLATGAMADDAQLPQLVADRTLATELSGSESAGVADTQ